jgi:thiol-disulfide isomerase/thioredoxin
MHLRLVAAIFLTFVVSTVAAEELPHKLAIGAPAPQLDFRLLDGKAAPSWSELRGNVVVVDFWATWCAPCVGAIPHMNALQKELAGEPVRFFSVTYEPKGKASAFLAQHPMETPVAIDNDLATFSSYIAWGIPMAYIIDRQGKVASVIYPPNITAGVIRAVLAGKTPDVEQHTGWKDPAGAAKYFREQLQEDRKKFGE